MARARPPRRARWADGAKLRPVWMAIHRAVHAGSPKRGPGLGPDLARLAPGWSTGACCSRTRVQFGMPGLWRGSQTLSRKARRIALARSRCSGLLPWIKLQSTVALGDVGAQSALSGVCPSQDLGDFRESANEALGPSMDECANGPHSRERRLSYGKEELGKFWRPPIWWRRRRPESEPRGPRGCSERRRRPGRGQRQERVEGLRSWRQGKQEGRGEVSPFSQCSDVVLAASRSQRFF